MDLALELDPSTGSADMVRTEDETDLATTAGLENAVELSLFLDRKAEPDDEIPDGSGEPRGWWADEFGEDKIGSRLWLLGRAKKTEATRRGLEDYAREALAWLVEDRVAASVDAAATFKTPAEMVLMGLPAVDGYMLAVDIKRPAASSADAFRYALNWDAELLGRA